MMFGRKAMAISKAGREKPEAEDADKTDIPNIDDCVIVYGRDDAGKAHASRFDVEIKQAAIRAAHVMGFHALTATDPAMKAIAGDLPEGRVFDSGKAFVPFVKSGVCMALESHAKQFPGDLLELSESEVAELAQTADSSDSVDAAGTHTDDTDDNELPPKSDPPADWVDVDVGTTVLAVDDPDDGWWEAEVSGVNRSGIGTNTGVMLTLKWTAFPEEPSFKRWANEVAYFHPAYGQSMPADNQSSGNDNRYAKAKAKTSDKA